MGNPFDTGGNQRSVVDYGTTRRNQARSDTNRREQFVNNYVSLFGNPTTSNPRFQESLSGYFNGASIPELAQMFSRTNTFLPKVPVVKRTVGDEGNGLMGLIPDPLDTIMPGAGYMARTSLF